MSGDTYSIFVKVDATQAQAAAKVLESLAASSDSAENSIDSLGKTTSSSAGKISSATKAVKDLANEYKNAAGIIDTSGLGAKLGMGGAAKTLTDSMKEIDSTSRKAAGGMESLQKVAATVRSTFVLFVGIEIARFLRDTASATKEAADAYTNMKSKLDIATYSQQELNKAFEDSFNIANKYYTSVTDVAAAYAKFNPIVASLGRNTSDTAKIVESLSASLLISGNNTVDAAETFRQFAQAISGPKIQMEEMNTIIDSNQALWRGLQREFPDIIAKYGSLKEAISKQAITNEMLINATIKLGDEFEALATRRVPTIANAMSVLSNSFLQYIGETDDATGASGALANVILDLADAMRGVEGKGTSLATVINGIAQAMAMTRGATLDLMDAFGQLFAMSPSAGVVDPEIAKLMQMAKGQVPIDELAAKQTAKPTTQPQLTPKGAGGGDAKQAAKEAKDALAAFKALIDAQISAASNSEKIFAANAANSKKRYEIEADQIKGLAELKIRSTKSEEMRLSIAEEAQAKIIESINQETNLRQVGLDKEIETTKVKLDGVQQEIDAADAHKLKQAERIELTTKQAELETELATQRVERTQIELDAIGQIQNAEQSLAEARQQANEALVKEEALRQMEIMSSNLEYAKEMALGLANAFGEVGAAIGGMSVAMAEYDKQATTIEIARKEAVDKAEGNQAKIDAANADASKKQVKAEIKKYGDMAQAAQGFFKKNTSGYKAMEAATKAFRVFEVAQSAMSMAEQLSDMATTITAFIMGETTKAAASAASVPTVVAAEKTKQTEYALTDIAAQGGIPIVGFALMAAMAAALAAFGIAGGGGGGSVSVPSAPTGSGTVKGDPMAVSESISKSLDILVENSSNDLNYSADMLESLQNIESALTGVSEIISAQVAPLIDSVVKQYTSAEGAMTTSQVKAAGFYNIQGYLGQILKTGLLQGSLAARIETETMGIKGGKTLVTQYGNDIAASLGKVVQALNQSIIETAKSIGITEETITKRSKGFMLFIDKIDLAGKSSEESAKLIEAAFSSMSDSMARKLLPEFKKFQRNGEGYFETMTRVGEGINRAKGNLELLGMEAIDYTAIIDKQKDVAAEMTRQTIMAQGDLSDGTEKYVRQLTGSSEDIIAAYKQILNITNLMRGAGFGTENIDRTMINAAGGLSAFEEALQSFRDNFMTDEQKLAADAEELNKAFAKLGKSVPASKEDFYAVAMGMDKSTEAGKKLFAQFLLLNGKFSDFIDASKELADAQYQAAVDAHEKIMDELQGNADKAFSAMQKSYQDLSKVQDRFLAISKNLRAYLSDLTGGGSAFMSPEARYRAAKAEFARIGALAAMGNETALGQLTSAGKTFLDASKDYNASSTQFQSDFMAVTQTIESSAQYAETQVDVAESQLKVAEASYSQLKTLDTSVLSVRDAIGNLTTAMGKYADEVAALAAAPAAPVITPVVVTTPSTGSTSGVSGGSTGTTGLDIFGLLSANPVGPFFPGTSSGLFDNNTSLMGPFQSSSSGNNNVQLAQTMQSVATETKASVNVQQEAFSQMIVSLSSIDSRLSDMERNQRLSV